MTNRRSFLLGLAFMLGAVFLFATKLKAQSDNTDCFAAKLLCEPGYFEDRVILDAGTILNEVNDDYTCMDGQEAAVIWYKFKPDRTGRFGFTIEPVNPADDYDWALFNLTNATCEDLATFRVQNLLVSCNAVGSAEGTAGPCNGTTGMSETSIHNIQGLGCDAAEPGLGAGQSPFNAVIDVVAGNSYVLAVQNWTATGTGNYDGYTINFDVTPESGIIDTEPPVVIDVQGGPSICDNEPVTIFLNEEISCDFANEITCTLVSEVDGSVLQGEIFAADCLRGATGVSELVVTFNNRGATPGDYTLVLDNTSVNQMGLRDGCGNAIPLPFTYPQIVNIPPDLSLDIDIAPIRQHRNNNFCDGQPVTLRAEDFFDFFGTNNLYSWTRPDGTTFEGVEIVVDQTGIYTVDVLQNGARPIPGCKRGTATYDIPNDVTIDLGADRSGLCAGTTETVIAQAGGNSYTWSNGTTGRTISVTESGTYMVTVVTNCGDIIRSIDIQYDEIPFAVDQSTVSTCPGNPVMIGGADIGGGATYSWNTGQTTSRISVNDARTYTVNVTQNGCTITRSVTVNASPEPDLNISQNGFNVCPNDPDSRVTLTALDRIALTTDFIWENGSTDRSRVVRNGTYMVTATNDAGCESMAEVTIGTHTVSPASISINGQVRNSIDICEDEQAILTASAGSSWSWNNGSPNQQINEGGGSYDVVVTDNNGCESTTSATVNEVANPTISLASSLDCTSDRSSYSFSITTQTGNTVITQGGVGTVSGNNGNFTISGVPEGQNVTLIARNGIGCETPQTIAAISCGCPNISAPNPGGTVRICAGETNIPPLTVSANPAAGEEIRWYNSPSGSNSIGSGPSLNVNTPGSYYAEVINPTSNCFSSRVEVQLIINPQPQASISGVFSVCPPGTGAATQLTANLASGTANQIQWSNNSSNPTITVGAAGMYSVTITDQNNCQAIATQTVAQFPTPTASITGDFDFCPGETATLTASGGDTYAWNTTSPSSTIRPSNANTYTVTVTDANGCEAIASQTVTENPVPVITIPDGAASCSDDLLSYDVQVNVFPDGSLTVNGDVGTVQGGGSSFVVEDVPVGEDITVTVTNAAGCTDSQFIAAIDCECPVVSAPQSVNNPTICVGQTIPALSVSNAGIGADSQVRWFDSPSGGAELGRGLSYTPSTAGTYYAEIINLTNDCKSQRTAVSLTINQNPVADITGNLQVCPDGRTTLNGGSASSYNWSSNSASPSIDIGAGTYGLTITDANGCQDDDSVTVTEFTVADASITGDLAICPGEMTELRASAGESYQWSNFAPSDRVNVSAGTYSVTVTDINNCESVATETVIQNDTPPLALVGTGDCSNDLTSYSININTAANAVIVPSEGIVNGLNVSGITSGENVSITVRDPNTGCTNTQSFPAPNCDCPSLSAPSSLGVVEVCEGQPLQAISVSNAGISSDAEVRWYNSATGGTEIASGVSFTPSMAGTYFAEVYNLTNNCTSSRTPVTLTVNPTPTASISGANAVCPSEEIQLTAGLTNGTANSFTWSSNAGNANTPMVSVGAGIYTVTVVDNKGCETTQSRTITEHSVEDATISGDLTVCPDLQTQLIASGDTGFSYNWNNFAQSDRVNVGVGNYSVTVTDPNGCTDIANAEVTQDDLPEITLVNGSLQCAPDLESYQLQISTAADNNLTSSLGNSNGAGGFFNITDVTNDVAVSITVTDPTTGCSDFTEIPAPDCNCPVVSAPQGGNDRAICVGDEIPTLSVGNAGIDSESEIRWYSSATANASIASGLNFTPDDASSTRTYFAEIYNTTTNCTSPRAQVTLTVNSVPTATITGNTNVCPGGDTQLSASIDAGTVQTYAWSASANNENGPNVNVGEGVYNVTITDANNCVAEATRTVNTFVVDAISINGDMTVCPDQQTQLIASGAATYAWSNFAQSDRVNVGVGTYMVTATDANGCETIESASVTQDDLPTITLVDNSLACAMDLESYGLQIQTEDGNNLTSSLGNANGAGGFFNITGASNEIPVTITVTDPNTGCEDSQQFPAPDCSCPVVSAPQGGNDEAICVGDAIPALAVSSAGVSADAEIRWYTSATGGSVLATGTSFTPDDATTRTYFAEIYDTETNCTSPRTQVTLTVNNLPTASISGGSQVCPGLTTDLIASISGGNAQSFSWSADANNAVSPDVTVGAGMYSVVVTDANGCIAQATQEVTTFIVDPISINGDVTVCPDEQTQLIASGAVDYAWSNFAQSDRVNVAAGTYMVTATDANSCESIESVTVTEDELPSIQLVDNSLACAMDLESYGLQVQTDAGNELTTSLGTATGAGGFFNITGATNDIPVTITVTDSNTGCEDSQQFPAPDCSCPVVSAPQGGNDQAICVGDATPELSVSSAGVSADSEIRWYTTATGGAAIAMGTNFTPSDATTRTYFAEIFNTETTCTSPRTQVTLTVNELPMASISGASEVCPGLDTELTASIAGGNVQSYTWSNNEQSPTVSVGAGTYSVVVTDDNGCVAEAMQEVTNFTVDEVSITGDLTVCPGLNTELMASGSATYSWSNFAQSDQVSVGIGTYSVTATDANGCESIASETITEDALPTITLVDASLACAMDLESYGLQITTEAGNNLISTIGTATGSGGFFTVEGATNEIPVTITVTDPNTGCEDSQQFAAPDCNCPVVSAPQGGNDAAICAGDAIPELRVSNAGVNAESEIRWYSTSTAGAAIATGVSFMPADANATTTYFAEIFNTETNCTSPRAQVTLTVNEVPTASISGAPQVCPDGTTDLSASISGGTVQTYTWSNGEQTPTVSVGAGMYDVVITDVNGCIAQTEQEVTTFSVAPISIDGDINVCPDETTELTVSGAATYEWSNFAQSDRVTVGVGTYSVTATDVNGCESIESASVVEDALPTITLIDASLACAEDLESYGLQITTEAGNELTSTIGIVTGTAGIFTVEDATNEIPVTITVTDPNTGCEDSQQFAAPDCNCPVVSAPQGGTDMVICEGEDLPALTVTNAGVDSDSEIRWYSTATGGAAIGTGLNFTPVDANTATYFAEIFNTETNCTSPRSQVTLTINALPMANISGTLDVCPGLATDLTASLGGGSAAQNYTWSSNALNATTEMVNVGAGIYTVTITDENNCIDTETVTVNELPAAVAVIDGDATVCPDATTDLTASGGITFEWSNFGESATTTLGAGDHSVTVTDANGCTGITTIEVTEDALPSITLVDGLQDCADDRESYSFQISTEVGNELTSTLGTPSGTNGLFQIEGVPAEAPVTITVFNPTTGCEDTQLFTAPDCSCPQLAAPMSSGDMVVCADDEIPALSANASLDADSEIRWYTSATANTEIAIGNEFTPDAAGDYYAEIYNRETACTSTRQLITLTILDEVSVSIVGPTEICPNPNILTELSVDFTGAAIASYQWSASANNLTTPTTIVDVGDYSVTVTDENGCAAEASINITALEIIPVVITGETMICPDGVSTTTLMAENGENFLWDGTTAGNNIDVGVGTYMVLATDANGCFSEASVDVTEHAAPSLTLSSAAACSDDLTSYDLEVTTEAGNTVVASLGTVSEAGGIASITGVTPEMPVTITITNGTTGCVTEQTFVAPNCNCPDFALPMVSTDIAICVGDVIPALTASSPDLDETRELRWYDADIDGNIVGTGVNFTPIAAGTYFAEVFEIDSECSSARIPVALTINDLPTPSITGETEVCPDDVAMLTATGGASFVWSSGETIANIEAPAGDYNVTVTDANNCVAEANFSVATSEVIPVVITGETMICPDGVSTTILMAENGESFLWDGTTAGNSIDVGVGTYTVVATDANGCLSEASTDITEHAAPSLTLSSAAGCSDDLTSYGLEITTEAGNTVVASLGTVSEAGGIASITGVTPEMPVTITITNGTTGCVTEQTFVAPNCNCPDFALPMVSTDVAICVGDVIPALTASSPDLDETRELRWYDADIDGNIVGTGIDFTPTAAGTYFAEVFEIDSECSSARIPVTLTINDLPTPSITGEMEICEDATTTLTAIGGTSFTWGDGEITGAIDVPAGDYNVVATDVNGCSAEANFSVSNFTPTPASITGELGICPGEMTTLTASAGTAFQWDNGEITESIEVGAGLYNVLVTDANGCQSPANVEVIENALPSFSVPQAAACAPDLLSYNIQLQTAAGNTVIADMGTVSDLGNGLWEITGIAAETAVFATITDPNTNCTTAAEFPAPNCNCPSFSTPVNDGDVTICSGDAILALSVSNIDDGLVVNWYDAPVGGNIVGTGASFIPSAAGVYHAEALDEASACASLRAAVSLTINELPDVSIAASADGACGNDVVNLMASGATDYTWSSGETTASVDLVPGTYTVTGIDANACESTATQVITAFPTPSVSVNNTDVLCGDEFDMVTANGGDSYTWSTGETTPTVELNAGTYSVTATNMEGCTDEVAFTIAQAEAASANLGADQTLCGETVELSPGAFTPGTMMFEWSDGSTGETLTVTESGDYRVTVIDGCGGEATSTVSVANLLAIDAEILEAALGPDTTNCTGQVSFDLTTLQLGAVGDVSFRWQDGTVKDRFVAIESGTVTLTATNECGDASAIVEVEECETCSFYAPNAFSPNDDLNNDTFKLFTNCEITNYNFKVYDRWGAVLFETQDLNEGWNGMYNDERPVDDTFVWMISYDIVDRYGVTRSRVDSGSLTIQR